MAVAPGSSVAAVLEQDVVQGVAPGAAQDVVVKTVAAGMAARRQQLNSQHFPNMSKPRFITPLYEGRGA